jgi:hypothetical protein
VERFEQALRSLALSAVEEPAVAAARERALKKPAREPEAAARRRLSLERAPARL